MNTAFVDPEETDSVANSVTESFEAQQLPGLPRASTGFRKSVSLQDSWKVSFYPTGDKAKEKQENMTVTGQTACIKTHQFAAPSNEQCNMLVSGCGGPIAVQNHDNELLNWGLDYPRFIS